MADAAQTLARAPGFVRCSRRWQTAHDLPHFRSLCRYNQAEFDVQCRRHYHNVSDLSALFEDLRPNRTYHTLSYDWIGGWEVPFPDFDTYHKCRNFDEILDWMTQNRVHIPQEHMVRISGETDLPEWHPPD